MGGAGAADVGEFALEAVDLFADAAAVEFELGFAFAFGADAAGLLAEVGPGAFEAGEGVGETSELDLDAGFAGLGALGEDVEDDFVAVDDGEFGEVFPVALLGWGEFVIEDEEVGVDFFCVVEDFLGFA